MKIRRLSFPKSKPFDPSKSTLPKCWKCGDVVLETTVPGKPTAMLCRRYPACTGASRGERIVGKPIARRKPQVISSTKRPEEELADLATTRKAPDYHKTHL